MSQMKSTEKILTNLGLNPRQLVHLVLDWVGCCVM